LGGAKALDLEDQDKGVAVVIPTKKPKRCSKRGAFAVFFLGGGTLFLPGVLAKNGW
jgi:hypothetical protein